MPPALGEQCELVTLRKRHQETQKHNKQRPRTREAPNAQHRWRGRCARLSFLRLTSHYSKVEVATLDGTPPKFLQPPDQSAHPGKMHVVMQR